MKNSYHIGLDIGTSSIGYAVMDDNYHLIHKKGKTLIGTRLFKEGKTAADRRVSRTTRRRLKRRKWRLKLLEDMFAEHLAEVDPNFLARLHNSNLISEDQKTANALLFPNSGDKEFYKDYPTIYHLRYDLMTKKQKFDIREIYLAIHHIVKYRGNFLNPMSVKDFKNNHLSPVEALELLPEIYVDVLGREGISVEHLAKIEDFIEDKRLSRKDKASQMKTLMFLNDSDKDRKKENTALAKELSNAILGMKAQFSTLLCIDNVDEDVWKKKYSFNDKDFEENLTIMTSVLDNRRIDLLLAIKKIHDQIELNSITPDGMGFSEAMKQKYETHKEQLYKLKSLYPLLSHEQVQKIKNAYALYIDGIDEKTKTAEKYDKRTHISADELGKTVRNVLTDKNNNISDNPDAQELLEAIKLENFLPKQRTSANGVIPNQMHQIELDAIIENQAPYYPWLAEENPVESHRKNAPYKLDELLTFRVPYYVGPMITKEDQEKYSGANFAWMIRKDKGAITPWNFEDKVDAMASANEFIKRMTSKDTYLIGEDVLPASSLLYQRFTVLNELNNISVDGRKLPVDLKRDIYNELFKDGSSKTVSAKKLQGFLECHMDTVNEIKIHGLADEKKLNSSLGTYHDLVKILGKKVVDDENYRDDLEDIVEYITIFEDKNILKRKLHEISWLKEDEISRLANLNYSGWGRLSRKLLTGLIDTNGQRIIDRLWNTQENFMQIQASEDFQTAIQKENNNAFEHKDIEDILADAYTSPQNKKAIRQVMLVVKDIEKAMECAPKSISIEFTRTEEKSRQTVSRINRVQDALKKAATEITEESQQAKIKALQAEFQDFSDSKKKMSDKYYLYFTQMGRDIYTGEALDIDKISQYYDKDHILPRAFIKDDSLDNRVLTKRPINNEKSDTVPVREFGSKMGGFWKELKDLGLISKHKYINLITDPENVGKYKVQGFIRRQLVETSQVIKLTAEILNNQYSQTKVIEVRQKYTHELREHFSFYKIRQLNDYHHAFDAYLTVFIGRYLYQRYPRLRGYFVYGDFKEFDQRKNHLKFFNFLYDIEEGQKDEILDNVNHELVMNRSDAIAQLRKAYGYKYMLVSQEVYTNHGAMFDESLYSKKSKKTLIPIKKDKPVELYGGYSGNKDAYLAIARVEDKKGIIFQVVGIPMRNLAKLNRLEASDKEVYLRTIHEIVDTKINDKPKSKKKDFRVILPKVHFKQLVEDSGKKFMLAGVNDKHNAQQLVLSLSSIKALVEPDITDVELDAVYQEILDCINKYFKIYDKVGAKLATAKSEFEKLDIETKKVDKNTIKGKRETLLDILDVLHANAMRKKILSAGELGRLSGNIKLTENAKLIYQSPTGIVERIVYLKDL